MNDRRSKLRFVSVMLLFAVMLISCDAGLSQRPTAEPQEANEPPVYIPKTPTKMPGCVKYPVATVDQGTLTPTPGPSTLVKEQIRASVTPRPITNIFDLSPQAPQNEKRTITVFRCDGIYVQYVIGPGVKVPEDLHLHMGDTIIYEEPVGNKSLPPTSPANVDHTIKRPTE